MSTLLSNVEYIDIVTTASNGKEVLEYLKIEPVDLRLIDMNMPELDGIQTTKKNLTSTARA